jgi:hypothetical protein
MTADITTLAEWEAHRCGAADGERRGRARKDLRLLPSQDHRSDAVNRYLREALVTPVGA